jgi:RNA polymerase sigma-70 factor, ECF subfamily
MTREKITLPVPFEQIMRRHEREILRYLLRASKDQDDAADLFQETWLRAYRAYPRLDPMREVRPWLFAIAVNLCRNRARDGARRRRLLVPENDASPARDARRRAHRASQENDGYAAVRMRELVAALPPKRREALRLRYFAGLDYAEIAAVLNCSAQGARANVSQAVRKIQSTW